MLTEWLRKVFKGIVERVASLFMRAGLSANALTLIGCLLNVGVGVIIATGNLSWGGLALLLASAFDGLDGTLARLTGKATKFGAFLDSVLDRVSESAIFLGLAWYYMGQPGLVEEMLAYVSIVGSLLVSYTRARAEGVGVECKVGLFTRVERCAILIAGLVLKLTTPMLWLMAIGTVLTAIHRILHVYQQAKDQPL